MSRHAKNACSYSVFSHAERKRLAYGTRARRAGLDAQKPFDSCELCLNPADQPVTCHKGHVFCRACIVESMAQQKEINKLALAKYEAQQAAASAQVGAEAEKTKAKQVAAFEKLEAALLQGNARTDTRVPPPQRPADRPSPYAPLPTPTPTGASSSSSAAASASDAPAGYVRVETTGGSGFIVDRAAVHAQFDPHAPREVQEARHAYMPAFWTPSMAPSDVGESKMTAPPPQHCLCPGSNHTLRLKQLRPIRWCLERERTEASVRATSASATSSSNAAFKQICFACKRHLSNQVPMQVNMKCGHVLCTACIDRLMRGKKRSTQVGDSAAAPADASSSSHASTTLSCAECEESCTADDLVPIVAATGFAATGNKMAESKLTPAFRC